MATAAAQGNSAGKVQEPDRIMFILAYLIPLITGIVIYLLYAEQYKRLKFHGLQAMLYGIAFLVIYVILSVLLFVPFFFIILELFSLLAWLYGLYIGYQAYLGKDMTIPVVGDYAKKA